MGCNNFNYRCSLNRELSNELIAGYQTPKLLPPREYERPAAGQQFIPYIVATAEHPPIE